MASNATLNTLARSLSDDERRYLHDRIVHSLNLSKRAQDQHLVRGEMAREQRISMVRREIAEFSLLQRLVFKIRKVFSGEDDESVLIAMRLLRMKRRVQRGGRQLIDLNNRTLGPEFAERIFELYRYAYPVIPLVKTAWARSEMLRQIVEFHLRRHIPGAKYELEHFISLKEMQELFREREYKTDIRTEVLKRLKTYIDGIQEDAFGQIADGVLPLYHLRGLGLFPFDEFFQLYSYTLDLSFPQQTASFQPAELIAAAPYLEQLYYALYLASKHGRRKTMHEDVLRYYLLVEREGSDPSDWSDPQALEREVAEIDASQVSALQDSIDRLYDQVERTLHDLPLVELIKIIHEDPYYRLMVYLPRLYLQQFYHAALKMQLLTELDELFLRVRVAVVNSMIQELFGEEPPEFECFRASIHQSVKKLGLPGFKHMRSLQVMHHFMRSIYRPQLADLLRILSRIVPVRVKESARDMLTVASELEDVAEKIHLFDIGLSPDADEGKTFYRLRYAVEKDPKQQRAYWQYVAQKDREARGLLDKGYDRISELMTVLTNIKQASTPALNDKFVAMRGGSAAVARGSRPLDEALEHHLVQLNTLYTLMRQLISVEEEQ